MSRKLYFMALMPHKELTDEIRVIQHEMENRFHSGRALRPPVHITILPPFWSEEMVEKKFNDALPVFFKTISSFQVQLNGFGSFPPRVIYIKPEENPALQELYKSFMQFLRSELDFPKQLTSPGFTPHITVAYRDLSPEMYEVAWKEFKIRTFSASFEVNAAYLLRHDSKMWETISEFKLKT